MTNGALFHLATLTVLAGAVPALAVTTIDTLAYSTNQRAIGSRAYGQTFVTPSVDDVYLDSIRFRWREWTAGAPANFDVHVSRWDPVAHHLTGPLLFTSPAMLSVTSTVGQEYLLDTGDLELVAGETYIFTICTMHHPPNGGRGLDVNMVASSTLDFYPQGELIAFATATSFAQSYTLNFPGDDLRFGRNDMAMVVTFVPEPAVEGCWSLLGSLTLRRRRAKV